MKRQILNRWSDAVIWEGEAETVRDAIHAAYAGGANLGDANLGGANLRDANLGGADLRDADLRGANLGGANLRGANLRDANLRGADLRGANLRDANLRGADLRGANLGGADLGGADLRDANLRGANLGGANLRGANLGGANLGGANLRDANLRGANLRDANLRDADVGGANLRDANLRGADLQPIRDDVWSVLSSAPHEVAGLLVALKEGRVDGSCYEGSCACLVGTIANVAGKSFDALPVLKPNAGRPAEKFFLGINKGDTPATNQFSTLAVEWIQDWHDRMASAFGPKPSGE